MVLNICEEYILYELLLTALSQATPLTPFTENFCVLFLLKHKFKERSKWEKEEKHMAVRGKGFFSYNLFLFTCQQSAVFLYIIEMRRIFRK